MRSIEERYYQVKWRCEDCEHRFATLVEGSQVDTWSSKNLPLIPACPKCRAGKVFYQGSEAIGNRKIEMLGSLGASTSQSSDLSAPSQ